MDPYKRNSLARSRDLGSSFRLQSSKTTPSAISDTIDTAGDFEGQSEKCDKELEHIEDDIHNIEEKPEGGVEDPEVGADPEDAEDVEGAESPYDAVKAYELERQQVY